MISRAKSFWKFFLIITFIVIILGILLNEGYKAVHTFAAQQCRSHINAGISMLRFTAKCSLDEISYELPNGSNKNPKNPTKKSCFLFDKEGAGLRPCGDYKENGSCPSDILNSLTVGEVGCGYITYAGNIDGRLYTTTTDLGMTLWATAYTPTDAVSVDDGKANTDKLIAVGGKPAAQVCRRLGPNWYLPALSELDFLWKIFGRTNGFQDTFYWSSTDTAEHGAWMELFSNGTKWGGVRPYGIVRCVRK